MALIYCKECGHKISDKAISCPNCGFKIKKKSSSGCSTIIAIIVIVLFIFYLIGTYGKNSSIITDESTYSQSWRTPYGNEYGKIGKIIIANRIKVCGEYYLKEISVSEYLIACTADGLNWNYYVVYTESPGIFSANDEMVRKLTPPR